MIARLAADEPLFCGAWLLLRDDLRHFGAQPYREASERAITRVIDGYTKVASARARAAS